jgi:hypothetical protein
MDSYDPNAFGHLLALLPLGPLAPERWLILPLSSSRSGETKCFIGHDTPEPPGSM